MDPDTWENSPYDQEDWDFYQDVRQSDENPKVLKLYRDAEADCCWVKDGIRILAPTEGLVKEANKNEDWDLGCTPVSIQLVKKQYLKLSVFSPPSPFPSLFPSRSLRESGTLWQNAASFCCIRPL